jgi:hypothetical protein
MQILCEAVAGDRVVAEYLLMHILSFMYVDDAIKAAAIRTH